VIVTLSQYLEFFEGCSLPGMTEAGTRKHLPAVRTNDSRDSGFFAVQKWDGRVVLKGRVTC